MPSDSDTNNLLTRDLTRSEFERLVAAGLIPENQRAAALEAFRRDIHWQTWAASWSGSLGAVFLLAGILFFFAWNWAEFSPVSRFSILEAALLLCVLGALKVGYRKPVGQWLLLSASVFTGILIAVYGQVYQTGADAFEVFTLWAVLILVWVLFSRFAPLWILWIAVMQTALCTYGGQVLIPQESLGWSSMYLILGLASSSFVILREHLVTHEGYDWLQKEWIRIVLVSATLIWLSAIPWTTIFEIHYRGDSRGLMIVLGNIIWMAAVIFGALHYTIKRPSLICSGLFILTGTGLLCISLTKFLIEDHWDEAGIWSLVGLLGIGMFSGATKLILLAAAHISNKSGESP